MADMKFKCIKGAYAAGTPAHIYFYDDVQSWTVDDFVYEFRFLENYVQPSEIWIHINSGGGSCVEGISAFSVILNSKYKTKTVNDGLAASMGSVIWAAGDELYARDYSLLMIHNPFVENSSDDPNTKEIVDAFRKQLVMIYQKRFGFSEEKVKEIMDGKDNVDGTWYLASEAVEAGFLPAENVIETEAAVRDKIAASIKGLKDPKEITNRIFSIFDKNTMPSATVQAGAKEDIISQSLKKNQEMTENEIKVVAAQLGLTGDKATESNVSARISELLSVESKFKTVSDELKQAKDDLQAVQTELTGAKASVKNLEKDLNEAKASLKTYQDAEKAARAAAIEQLVEDAIQSGKIEKDDKESWVKMAEANFDLTKKTLDSIKGREVLSQKVNGDPQNKKAAEEGMKTKEQEIQEKVDAAVGKDFQFRTFKED